MSQIHTNIQKAVYFGARIDSVQVVPFCNKSTLKPPTQQLPNQIWDFFFFDRNKEQGLRQLQDQEFYTKAPPPIFQQSIPRIKQIIQTTLKQGYIQRKQVDYLIGERNPWPRRFYLLPKIHKPQDKWPTPFMPPGRPIVLDCGSETYRI